MTTEKRILAALTALEQDFAIRSAVDKERHEVNQNNINMLFKMTREVSEKVQCDIVHEKVQANSRMIKVMYGFAVAVFLTLLSGLLPG